MVKLASLSLKNAATGTLVVPVCQDGVIFGDQTLNALVRQARRYEEFDAKKGASLTLFDTGQVKAARVIFFGLGKRRSVTTEVLRSFAGKAVKICIRRHLKQVLIAAPSAKNLSLETPDLIEALLEGAGLGNYRFDRYRNKIEKRPLSRIDILVQPKQKKNYAALEAGVNTILEGTYLARDWVSIPANDKTPVLLAKSIVAEAKNVNLTTTVMDHKALAKKRFGSLLAVAAGSCNKPRMVILEHHPEGATKTIALVGKGVTYDSGGINIKPTGSLETMKIDMAGAAAVAATLITAARLKLPLHIIGVLPLVENMVSGSAIRPGDIIRSYSGKTVEINNTDAEGRLILIDAISYAINKFKPDTLIDLATLTGASMAALGDKIAALFTPCDDMSKIVLSAGKKTHERCWRMPLPDDYKELMKSKIADISNMSSSRWGGAITAALFLSEFAAKVRWAHIDIAGPVYLSNEADYCTAGGTGFGVRLLCEILKKSCQKK